MLMVDNKIYNFVINWFTIFYGIYKRIVLQFSTILVSLFSFCGNYIEIPTYALLNTDLFCEDIAIRSVFQVFLVIIPQFIWLFQTFLLPLHH